MVNKYKGHAYIVLKKRPKCDTVTLLEALQYAWVTLSVCICRIENEPTLNIGKGAFRMLLGNNTKSVFFMKSDLSGVRVPNIRPYDGFDDTFDVDSLNTHGDVLRQKERK